MGNVCSLISFIFKTWFEGKALRKFKTNISRCNVVITTLWFFYCRVKEFYNAEITTILRKIVPCLADSCRDFKRVDPLGNTTFPLLFSLTWWRSCFMSSIGSSNSTTTSDARRVEVYENNRTMLEMDHITARLFPPENEGSFENLKIWIFPFLENKGENCDTSSSYHTG